MRDVPTPAGTLERRGVCLVFVSPSGGGKTAIMRAIVAQDAGIRQSVSVTTRPPRPGERDGVDYYFRDQDAFDQLVGSGGMIEHATVMGRSYGIPRQPIEDALDEGRDLAFAIDWQGHASLLAALPGDVVGVYLVPPSLAELEARLVGRGDTDAEIVKRMASAPGELSHMREVAHHVVNDDLPRAVAECRRILEQARQARMGHQAARDAAPPPEAAVATP